MEELVEITAQEAWDEMMDCDLGKELYFTAEITRETTFQIYTNGYDQEPEYVMKPIGTLVLIVMASRFGDLGIRYDDFIPELGYSSRVSTKDLTNVYPMK